MKKRIALMGATGSIGDSALSVAGHFRDRFEIVSMAAGSRIDKLLPAVAAHRPKVVAVKTKEDAARLRTEFPGLAVGWGAQGLVDVATFPEADVVLGALVGSVGLPSSYAAARLGKRLALANKETLVVAGELLMAAAREAGAAVIPVDSEHCALHQALRCGAPAEVSKLMLTASGGPFRTRELSTFGAITVDDALAHPTWRMGPKITIDSATMMNKGLEVIEARWLFDVPAGRIEVVLHPQSIVHSLVEFVDGSLIGQMSPNDMRFPILYALTYPDRIETPLARLDLPALGKLEFFRPEPERYPALSLAAEALSAGGSAPAVLNAANEIAVEAFLAGRIPFPAIVEAIARVLDRHSAAPLGSVEEALEVDGWARRATREILPALERPSPAGTAGAARA
jgi:1-deoxy-D-xylulose-5-phosphate reductoisomerase